MTAPWPLMPLGTVIDSVRYILWEFEGAKFGHRVVNNPKDPGGRTLSGLTLGTYSRDYLRLPAPALAPLEQFDALSLDDVVGVITELFAMRTGIHFIGDPALRFAVLDFAIHAGADDAIPALQQGLRVEADGRLGRETLGALERHPNPRALLAGVMDERYQKAGRRVVSRRDQIAFLGGWLARFGRVLRLCLAALLLLIITAPAQAQVLGDGGEPLGRDEWVASWGYRLSHAVGTSAASRPDPDLTPGETRPLTLKQVCETRWGTDRRFVTEAMKRHVFAAYGVPWSDRAAFEVDHLIPRSLGGADSILNLWPQPYAGEWGARKKDRLEVALGRKVCAGEMTLPMAQRLIRQDWMDAYRRVVLQGSGFKVQGSGFTLPAFSYQPTATFGEAPVTIDVLPRIALAPASARVTVRVERQAENRWLDISIDGEAYQRSSGRELAGDTAPRLFQLFYADLPAGAYTVSAVVTTAAGHHRFATTDLTVHGPEEGR